MIDQAILHDAATGLAALDFSEEVSRISDLRGEIAEMETAAETGQARMRELEHTLRKHREPNAGGVADALLNRRSENVVTLDPPVETLEAERRSLIAGIAELKERIRSKEREIGDVQSASRDKFAPVAQPLVDEIMERAREAGEQIRQCTAAFEAVYAATLTGGNELAVLRRSLDALTADFHLLKRVSGTGIPQEIVGVLAALDGKEVPRPAWRHLQVG